MNPPGENTGGAIETSGTIETEQIPISAALSIIIDIRVEQGEAVDRGQLLILLDDTMLSAGIPQAQAGLEKAEAQLSSVLANPRGYQVVGAQAALAQALARAEGAKKAWKDAIEMRGSPLELDTQINTAAAQLKIAELRVDLAQAQLSEAIVHYEASKGGGSDIEKTTTQILGTQVQIAEENVKLARTAVSSARDTLAGLQALRENPVALNAAVHRSEKAYQLALTEIRVQEAKPGADQRRPLARGNRSGKTRCRSGTQRGRPAHGAAGQTVSAPQSRGG